MPKNRACPIDMDLRTAEKSYQKLRSYHLQKTGMTEDEIEQLVKLVGGWSGKSITANADIKRKLIRLVHREH